MTETAILTDEIYVAAAELLTASKSFEAVHEAGSDAEFPGEAWTAAREAGWFSTILPESFDGFGLGLTELGAIFRAVGEHPLRGPLYDLAVVLPLAVAAAEGDVQARLRAGIDEPCTIVLARSAPPPYGGGDGAVVLEDGRLRGSVALVPFAGAADLFLVVCSSGGEPAVVLAEGSGVDIAPLHSHDPCVDWARISLDLPVSADDVVVSGASAQALIDEATATCRLMAAAEISGAVDTLLDMAVEYSKVREQFGRPIAGFQALRHLLATMAGRAAALRSLVQASLTDADADPMRRRELGLVAKAFSARVGRYVAEEALQVHGGIGFTAEYRLHPYFRRILTLQGSFGEPERALEEIGATLLGLAHTNQPEVR